MTTPHLPGQCPRKSATDDGKPLCVNCKGEHPANSPTCPSYIEYKRKVEEKRHDRRSASAFNHSVPAQAPQHLKQPAQARIQQIQHQGPSAASWASLMAAAPAHTSFQPQNHPQSEQHVSTNLNGNTTTPFGSLAHSQAMLLSIPGIREELKEFANFASAMKAAKDKTERRTIMFAFLMPENVN